MRLPQPSSGSAELHGLSVLDQGSFLLGMSGLTDDPAIWQVNFQTGEMRRVLSGQHPFFVPGTPYMVFSARSPTGRGLAVFKATVSPGSEAVVSLLDDGQYPSPRVFHLVSEGRVVYDTDRDYFVLLDVRTDTVEKRQIPGYWLASARPIAPELFLVRSGKDGLAVLRALDGADVTPLPAGVDGPRVWFPGYERFAYLRGRFSWGEVWDLWTFDLRRRESRLLAREIGVAEGSAVILDKGAIDPAMGCP
jgi:hypothetical protein